MGSNSGTPDQPSAAFLCTLRREDKCVVGSCWIWAIPPVGAHFTIKNTNTDFERYLIVEVEIFASPDMIVSFEEFKAKQTDAPVVRGIFLTVRQLKTSET